MARSTFPPRSGRRAANGWGSAGAEQNQRPWRFRRARTAPEEGSLDRERHVLPIDAVVRGQDGGRWRRRRAGQNVRLAPRALPPAVGCLSGAFPPITRGRASAVGSRPLVRQGRGRRDGRPGRPSRDQTRAGERGRGGGSCRESLGHRRHSGCGTNPCAALASSRVGCGHGSLAASSPVCCLRCRGHESHSPMA